MLLVCEHASNHVPPELGSLGLDAATLNSHIAWDPGAIEVAEALSELLDATLVASQVSRLVYDCNRPPHAPDAMPERSEIYPVPGNAGLGGEERQARVDLVYRPFRSTLREVLAARMRRQPVLVTIHSFTPVYNGLKRDVELGILCDSDERLADAMLLRTPAMTTMVTRKNEPYGPEHGVTHTLIEHGLQNGLANVMIEIRNDLISTSESQKAVAQMLANLISESTADLDDGAGGAH